MAFALIAAVASGFFREELEDQPSNVKALSGALSLLSVGLALGVSYLVGILIRGVAAWPVSAFSTTIIYVASVGIEVAVAHWLLRRDDYRRPKAACPSIEGPSLRRSRSAQREQQFLTYWVVSLRRAL